MRYNVYIYSLFENHLVHLIHHIIFRETSDNFNSTKAGFIDVLLNFHENANFVLS